MCKIKNELSLADKERIFDVKVASETNIEDLELRYEVEHGQEGEPDYLRQRVYRDRDGKYYMIVKGGTDATLDSKTEYCLDGREVVIPISSESLYFWAEGNLCGDEHDRAVEEFKAPPKTLMYRTPWLYQRGTEAFQDGYVFEFLWETNCGFYMLLSTEHDYPCFGHPCCGDVFYIVELDGGVSTANQYAYYVTPEAAQRWAEVRGMGETTRQITFKR